jgi:replicative DNA helicase
MPSTLDHALYYAKKGWRVFPCMPKDKKPAVRWADVATTEEKMILGWWDHNPDFNVGIAAGEKSGITVLDVDASHDGYDTLATLIAEHGKLPETPVVKTGSGGEHIFFKYAPGTRNSAGKLGKGLDIRSEGGYVVGANSIHPNGNRYEWTVKPSQTPLADMPEWMIDLLREPVNPLKIEPMGTGGIISGERNNALTQIAGAMRRKGMSADAIYAALVVVNRERCTPPLPETELDLISKSVTRYIPEDAVKVAKPLPTAWDVIDQLEQDILERQKNPRDVWGVHYAWPFLSIITGGKQKQELIILAGEPGVGKSWFAHQDALYTALGSPSQNIPSTPVLVWSGEMPQKQVYRRMFEMLGVPKRNMLTGNMSETDWQFFNEAKAMIVNSPIYVSDAALDLKSVRPMLEREIGEHGIVQAVFDYDWLISSPGHSEIEQSQNISREMKQLSRELNISIILISSVNKMGMDTANDNVTKANVSGSGKKLHDADVIYILTKFNEKKSTDLGIAPKDYQRIATLHIAKGRELDYHVPDGAINYMRETPNPKFREMKDMSRKDTLPSWLNRKDVS